MKKTTKKEIQHTIENAMNQALSTLKIAEPTKKTRKAIDKASKKITTEVKRALKKQTKKLARNTKASAKKKGKSVAKELVAA